ncbi:MAG TPA: hypothetical protein ENN17_05095 [bacterium]|nr:hypothetical protein [bacterium]
MNWTVIPVARILDDAAFRFASPDPAKITRLTESFRESGMRTPVVVERKGDGFRLLAGFSRLDAAREAGLGAVPAQIAVSGKNLSGPFYAALLEHRSLASFRLFEKARILHILGRLNPDPALRARFLRLLELPQKPDLLDAMGRLLTLSPPLVSWLEPFDVSLKQASVFLDFRRSDQEELAILAERLRIRPVELIEIAVPLHEIARRDGVPVRMILEETGPKNPAGPEERRPETVTEIRRRISERRFPRWSEIRSRIEAGEKALRLPANVRLSRDRTLEKPGLELQASLNAVDDVRELIRVLEDGIRSESFHKLFDLVG